MRAFPFVSFLAKTRETRTMSTGFMDRAKRDKRFTGTTRKCVRHFLRLVVPVIISGMPWVILIHAERGVDNLRTMESRLLSTAGKSVTNAIIVLQKAALFLGADEARALSLPLTNRISKYILYTITQTGRVQCNFSLFFKRIYNLLFPSERRTLRKDRDANDNQFDIQFNTETYPHSVFIRNSTAQSRDCKPLLIKSALRTVALTRDM